MQDKAFYKQIATQAAQKYGLDPALYVAQINQESGFQPNIKSDAGAIGIAQIMPETAKAWGVDPHDPVQSLDTAAREMSRNINTYVAQGYDPKTAHGFALAQYNGGTGAVDYFKRHGGIFYNPKAKPIAWANQTGGYVKKIFNAAGHDFENFVLGSHKPTGKAAPPSKPHLT